MAKSKNTGIAKDMQRARIPKPNRLVSNYGIADKLGLPTVQPSQPMGTPDVSDGENITDFLNAPRLPIDQSAMMQSRYDLLMSMPLDKLTADGYFVTTDNGSIFKGTMDSGVSFLPIQDIQQIENARGTAGALLMHFQQPAIAKDTAGHEGGSSTTFSGQEPGPEAPIIPEVANLPPVQTSPDGTTTFTDPNSVQNQLQSMVPSLGGKKWWMWYAGAAVLIIIILKFRK